jgi:hypothetical protein
VSEAGGNVSGFELPLMTEVLVPRCLGAVWRRQATPPTVRSRTSIAPNCRIKGRSSIAEDNTPHIGQGLSGHVFDDYLNRRRRRPLDSQQRGHQLTRVSLETSLG